MIRLPQFSIAQLFGFTFLCAIDVWAFLWDPFAGFWVTLITQVLFWSVLRVRAVLHMENQLKLPANSRRQWFWGMVIISVVNSVGAVVTFLIVVMAQVPFVGMLERRLPEPALALMFFGFCIPVGMLAAAVCLWWTWPRR